jgi:uncharacterized protein
MYHGTREQEVDDLLRGDRLVDLYKVVVEAIRTSEPRYSIKNMEAFYLPGGRQGAVKTAGDSIVIYERWRRLGGDALLAEIANYNEIDCRSTRLCRDWLLSLRPDDTPWFTGRALVPTDQAKVAARKEADERTRQLAQALIAVEDAPGASCLPTCSNFTAARPSPVGGRCLLGRSWVQMRCLTMPSVLPTSSPTPCCAHGQTKSRSYIRSLFRRRTSR